MFPETVIIDSNKFIKHYTDLATKYENKFQIYTDEITNLKNEINTKALNMYKWDQKRRGVKGVKIFRSLATGDDPVF